MNFFTFLFLIVLAASFFLEEWLSRRQVEHVQRHRNAVPDAFQNAIPLESHQKAADYTVDKSHLNKIERIVSVVLLGLFTLGGGIAALQSFWNGFSVSPVWNGVALILSTLILMQIFELPLSLYQTFVIEERYGFNKTTPKQFAQDWGLQLALSIVLGGGILAIVLWVMRSTGNGWWFLAWIVLMGFSVLMSWIFPTFIAPLFNRFEPLADEALKKRLELLLERCDFHSKGMFVMDGSRRSGHGNAYFTGLGNSKRIVFFDTLIHSLEPHELEAVLAHELGHFKCRHVIKMLITSAAISFVGFAILGGLSGQEWFYNGLGVRESSHAAALLLFMLVAPVFMSFLQPIIAYVQRRYEFEADAFAARYTESTALISALVKLYRENANTLTPDPLYSAFHYSHPPAAVRIAHLATKQNHAPLL